MLRRSASCSSWSLDALMLLAADIAHRRRLQVDSFWSALVRRSSPRRSASCSRSSSGRTTTTTYTLRVIQRIARRVGRADRAPTHPGSSSWRSTGSRCPCCSARCATATRPTMARWLAEGTHRLAEWETDLSSQTGASQAGILLGSNEDIPAFRWVEKETGEADGLLRRRTTAPRSSAGTRPARACSRRRREPRQPALRRGRPRDPDRQPDGRREEGEPRLPRVLRQRLQRHARRSCSSSGRSCSSGRRGARAGAATSGRAATAAASTRSCAAAMCVVVRDLIVYGVLTRHDEGAARDLRDVLELRRGRAPLGARARRHARGAAQARRAVRRASSAPAVRARGRTRSSSSPTTARRRARRSSSATATGSTSSSSARSTAARSPRSPAGTRTTRSSATPSARRPARQRREKRPKNDVCDERRRRARLGQPRPRLPDGASRGG